MKIVFMGTPEFAVTPLEKIIEAGHEVALVISQPDKPKGRGKKLQYTPVKEAALNYGIEVIQPIKANNVEVLEKIQEIKPDIIVVVAYGQILKENILNIAKHGCYNIHASLLPKYRGAAPIQWAIINGETQTGITIMKMDKGLDSGDMLLMKEVDITPNMNAEELNTALRIEGGNAIVEALSKIESGDYELIPQNHEIFTYAPMLKKELGKIDWNKNAEEIGNLIRGVYPWPGAYTFYKGEKLKIMQARIEFNCFNSEIGKITKVSKDGIYVQVQDGCVVIETLQFPGKKAMKVRDYLAGNTIEENIVLGE